MNFLQELIDGHMKVQDRLLMQYYIINVLIISKRAPCKESSYFPLRKELKTSVRGLINIQNEDKECLRWWLVKDLNPENKTPVKIRSFNREFTKQHEGIKY